MLKITLIVLAVIAVGVAGVLAFAATKPDIFTVQRTASGGLVIEAPPESASALAALFSGMAQLLQAAASPVTGGGSVGQ